MVRENGEGIYDTGKWRSFGEGPTAVPEGSFKDGKTKHREAYTSEDIRYTHKPCAVYAFAMKSPADGVVKMELLGKNSKKFSAVIQKVSVLGYDQPCTYHQTEDYLTVITNPIKTDKPVCFKISYDE